jgi:hypothetical protein
MYGSTMPIFHHPAIDVRTGQQAKLDLARLERCPIASHLRHSCRRHDSQGDFDFFNAACKLHLVNVGRQVRIDDKILDMSLDPGDYDQYVLETVVMMG